MELAYLVAEHREGHSCLMEMELVGLEAGPVVHSRLFSGQSEGSMAYVDDTALASACFPTVVHVLVYQDALLDHPEQAGKWACSRESQVQGMDPTVVYCDLMLVLWAEAGRLAKCDSLRPHLIEHQVQEGRQGKPELH
jgi:hypothetical protein